MVLRVSTSNNNYCLCLMRMLICIEGEIFTISHTFQLCNYCSICIPAWFKFYWFDVVCFLMQKDSYTILKDSVILEVIMSSVHY